MGRVIRLHLRAVVIRRPLGRLHKERRLGRTESAGDGYNGLLMDDPRATTYNDDKNKVVWQPATRHCESVSSRPALHFFRRAHALRHVPRRCLSPRILCPGASRLRVLVCVSGSPLRLCPSLSPTRPDAAAVQIASECSSRRPYDDASHERRSPWPARRPCYAPMSTRPRRASLLASSSDGRIGRRAVRAGATCGAAGRCPGSPLRRWRNMWPNAAWNARGTRASRR